MEGGNLRKRRVCNALHCIPALQLTLRQGRDWDERFSAAPTFTNKSFDAIPGSPKKSAVDIFDRSPLDLHFSPNSQRGSMLAPKPQLQEMGGKKPRYFSANSIVSDVALLTTPPVNPTPTSLTLVATPLEPVVQLDQDPTGSAVEGENHPPAAFNTALFNSTTSRYSNGSGLLSIITLPSFITNDRPRTQSSSTAAKMESPVQPQSHYRKQSSNLSQRFSATESCPPASPVSEGDTVGKRSRPSSTMLQIITSALKRSSSSTSSSMRSVSPSSRRSSRRSLGRRNPSLGADDEAVIQWRKLPPIPTVQGSPAMQNSPSPGAGEVKGAPSERLPSYAEKDPKPHFFLPAQIPLPPSPLTAASSVSSLAYAPPSPQEISPINCFTTSYLSHFPLPPSVPSTPRSFVYPPLPPSIPSTPRQFSFPPLPPSIPSTPGQFSYPPLPPSIPSTPRQFSYPPLPPSVPSTPGTFGYPPLPPSAPSTPGQFSYPPLPPSILSTPNSSTEKLTEIRTSRPADRLVSLAIHSLRRLSGETCRTQSGPNTPSTTTVSVFPDDNDDLDENRTEWSIHPPESLAYSPSSGVQELVLPPRPLFAFPSSPPPPMSPRGPRPRPQLSRSGTWHSKSSSNGQ